jgi:hypothetical protein
MKKLLMLLIFIIYSCGEIDYAESVEWEYYQDDLKEKIDNANCVDLQWEFEKASATSDAQRSIVGTDNSYLMDYMDQVLKEKGCY